MSAGQITPELRRLQRERQIVTDDNIYLRKERPETRSERRTRELAQRISKARPYIDAGWDGLKLSPTDAMLTLHYALSTSPRDDVVERAHQRARDWLRVARERWALGFSANPLTAEPVQRVAA